MRTLYADRTALRSARFFVWGASGPLICARATFSYDAVGNVLVKHHEGSSPITQTFDAASRVTTIQDGPTRVTFTYDSNGNPTLEQRGVTPTTFAYDRENRLIVRREGVDAMTMTYDGDGLRRSRLQGKKLTTFVWDGAEYLGETTIEVK